MSIAVFILMGLLVIGMAATVYLHKRNNWTHKHLTSDGWLSIPLDNPEKVYDYVLWRRWWDWNFERCMNRQSVFMPPTEQPAIISIRFNDIQSGEDYPRKDV